MTLEISRHVLPMGPEAEEFAECIGVRLVKGVGRLEHSSEAIRSTFGTALMALRSRCIIDPRSATVETWESAVTAMQVGSALFAVTTTNEERVECRIDRELRSIPATGPRSFADAGTWLAAFWLAVICRDQDRMTQLSKIPLDRLRSPEGSYDEYIYHWVDTLQSWWLRRPDLADKLIATIQASDPAVARIAPQDLLRAVLYPPINLFYHYVRNDRDGFAPPLPRLSNSTRPTGPSPKTAPRTSTAASPSAPSPSPVSPTTPISPSISSPTTSPSTFSNAPGSANSPPDPTGLRAAHRKMREVGGSRRRSCLPQKGDTDAAWVPRGTSTLYNHGHMH